MWYFGQHNDGNWGFDIFETSFVSSIELTDEEHDELVRQANEQGKMFSGDKDGNPILVDYPEPSEEEQKHNRIRQLENYLSETDWYVIRFTDTGELIPTEIKDKRQEARNEISELRESFL